MSTNINSQSIYALDNTVVLWFDDFCIYDTNEVCDSEHEDQLLLL